MIQKPLGPVQKVPISLLLLRDHSFLAQTWSLKTFKQQHYCPAEQPPQVSDAGLNIPFWKQEDIMSDYTIVLARECQTKIAKSLAKVIKFMVLCFSHHLSM
jgi:hypothetical protein